MVLFWLGLLRSSLFQKKKHPPQYLAHFLTHAQYASVVLTQATTRNLGRTINTSSLEQERSKNQAFSTGACVSNRGQQQ